MSIDQTKCDHCGKVHETPLYRYINIRLDGKRLLSVPLKVKGEMKYLDFCDEDCLRKELIKRNTEAKAKARKA